MKTLVVGATGTVGRRLCALLSADGASVLAAGRNQVQLVALARLRGVETVRLDATRADALPDADVLVDLTVHERRLPRDTVRSAEAMIKRIDDWLALDAHRRAVHTGTFVVSGYERTAPVGLVTRLVWDDSYLLSKSAAERAVSRARCRDRITVVRLGNVVTPDSAWGSLLLRAAALGSVGGGLEDAANLCDVHELRHAVNRGSGGVAGSAGIAGFTWREAFDGMGAGWVTSAAEPCPVPVEQSRTMRAVAPRLVRRALWLAPAPLARVRPWDVGPLLRPMKWVQSCTQATAPVPAGPVLPPTGRLAGAARDQARFTAVTEELAAAYLERGYAPLVA